MKRARCRGLFSFDIKKDIQMTASPKPEDRVIIEQLGAVTILFGIVEFVLGIVMAPKGHLNLQVGALLVGLAILFGSMRVVSAIRWLAWFALAPGLLILAMPFVFTPFDLLVTQFRLAPTQMLLHVIPILLTLALLAFTLRQLGSAPVLAARAAAGRKVRNMRIPLIFGVLAALCAAIMMQAGLGGEDAQKARQLAAERYGAKYQYHTNFIRISKGSNTFVEATVQAWNKEELHLIPVRWNR